MMSDEEQMNQVMHEGKKWIDRIRYEYQISYASIIGCLDILKDRLLTELRNKEKDGN